MKGKILLLGALVLLGSCKNSTDSDSNNTFSADISYNGAAASHYVSDDFHIHFNRVSGELDTIIITADRGEKADIFAQIFIEIDDLHPSDSIFIEPSASATRRGVWLTHTDDNGTVFTPVSGSAGVLNITSVDVSKQAIKGSFHCKLYENGILGGKTAEITNGSFSWNY